MAKVRTRPSHITELNMTILEKLACKVLKLTWFKCYGCKKEFPSYELGDINFATGHVYCSNC